MREIIVGTAGHIDHGKTALVEALTGTNTDRLKEEKLRGITIELGFASLTLPSGLQVGIVDVPGHERFVKTMVAGATGVDLVVLVVAADEGVMPQTREHLDICRLLQVKRGMVAITKVDLVDEEWLALVEEDLREFVRGTFLEGAPMVRTSTVTGEGIREIPRLLDELSEGLEERPPARFFRLPIDRVFIMKGFGTVVTGTLMQGRIAEGDGVEVAPKGIRTKVRGLQVHNRTVRESFAGTRTAVNLQAVEKEELERGDVLIPPGSLSPTHMADVRLEYLPNAPRVLKNRSRVRFHTGTSEILARVVLLDREVLDPGEKAYAQVRLEGPTVMVHGDPFVIRSYSPIQTIGGGIVLDGLPGKHRRHAKSVLQHLERIDTADLASVALGMLECSELRGLTRKELDRRLNLSEERWEEILVDGEFQEKIRMIDGGPTSHPRGEDLLFVSLTAYENLLEDVLAQLKAFHAESPLDFGISKDSLRGRCRMRPSARLFGHALQALLDRGEALVEGDRWRWEGHRFDLGQGQKSHLKEMMCIFQEAELQPPALKVIGQQLGISEKEAKDLAELLVRQAALVKVKDGLYFHAGAIEALKGRLVTFLRDRGEIQPTEFKELTGLSRKFMIPLLEYFDRTKVTMRVGDKRVLRGLMRET
jgi:selenocysteine-specific elongation factor